LLQVKLSFPTKVHLDMYALNTLKYNYYYAQDLESS